LIRELAERRFAALERLAPDSAAVKELAGRRFEIEGKLPDALREYRGAIAAEPGRPGVHFEAGNILWRLDELDAAAEELRTELARTPHHGLANLRMGQILLSRNEDQQALAFLEHTAHRPRQCFGRPHDLRRDLQFAFQSCASSALPTPAAPLSGYFKQSVQCTRQTRVCATSLPKSD